MDEKKASPIPMGLLVADAIGAFLLGISLAKQVAGVDIVPAPLRFENYGVVLIVAGVALMAPMVLHFLNRAREKGEATRL